ncbi:MAG: FAD-dependent oxidoreductase [Mariprofundus sp.]
MADYDILIIGGGIYGSGIAQASAASGYRTGLIEKKHIASGTSSQSTKLIHGGLRYLEQANLKLVYEALSERECLLRNAPDLVSREWFYIPVYRNSKRPAWMIRAGLFLYWLLSGGRSRFKSIPAQQWEPLAPGLDKRNMTALLAYEDAATDDAALTRAVAASAISSGCIMREQTALVSALYTDGLWQIILSNGETCSSRILINAAGPWVNSVHTRIKPSMPAVPVRLVQGTHLLLDRDCPSFIYTESVDGRVMFFRPWQGRMLAGTTEKLFEGDPNDICPTAQEIADILATHNHCFPASPCSETDILKTYCGLRVLPDQADGPFAASRETVICCDSDDAPAYIAVYGGKLTTYRKEATKVLRLIGKTIQPLRKIDTRRIILTPADSA